MEILRVTAMLTAVAVMLSACAPAAILGGGAVVGRSVVQERSTFDALTDLEKEMSISTRLAQHSSALFSDVGVDVVEGRVVLTGTVPRREDSIAATDIAWQTEGVHSVDNVINVGEDQGTRAYIADVGISNRVRFELLTDARIRSLNYNVETVDRVVHLTGLAVSEAELTRAIERARSIDGVERVVSHVFVIDDPRRLAPAASASGGAAGAEPPA